jgi:threonine dehydrogenase-like Zn-dependent dehydrogenase
MLGAVFIKPGEPLRIQHLPDPEPRHAEVVLRIVRCGICATDLHMTEDHAFAAPSGFILGHERGAEVVAVGPGVERLRIGDRVVPHPAKGCGRCADCVAGKPFFCQQMQMNMGGFAQYMVCSEAVCAKLPSSFSLADAALVEPLAVGLLGVQLNPFAVGAKIAVLGAGPIGLAAIFWAKRAGAGKIVAIATSRQRETLALEMGADAFLTTQGELVGEVEDRLGGPADVVLECAGVPGAIAQCVALVRPRGSVTVLGMCTHFDNWVPASAMLKEVKIQFAVGTSLGQFLTVADVLSAGHVEPRLMVTDTISLQQLPQVFEGLRARTQQCKVLVDPWLQA